MKTNAFVKISSLLLALLTLFTLTIPAFAAATTGYDVLTNTNYAKTFTLASSGKTIPYTSKNLSNRGTVTYGKSSSSYIDNSADELYVYDVGSTNGTYWAYVSYPTSSRRVYAYIPLSAISQNNSTHAKTTSTGKFYCAKRETSGYSSSYYVAKGDTVYLLSVSGDRCQILYPISGGKWRMAFCAVSDYEKYCAPIKKTTTENGMTDVTAYFAGKAIILRSVENGKYLCADANNSGVPAMCNRTSTTNWTVFSVSNMTADGWVGLKATTNGKYLSARVSSKDAPVRAYSSSLQSYECFRIYLKGNDFYIKAQANGKYLCVRTDKSGAPVQAYASVPSNWERFAIYYRGQEHYVSLAELICAATSNGFGANSNGWKALLSINSKYAPELTAAEEKGTNVFMFEGVGSNSDASVRMNAMCVVVKNGEIVYLNRNSSTIPDYPFNPAKNEKTPMPTLKSGIYKFTTVNHRKTYAALNVSGAQVVRFNNKNSFYNSTSTQINVHRRDSNAIAPSNQNWVNSAGCLLVGQEGTAASGEYAQFIQALGIVPAGSSGKATYKSYLTGKIVVDRTYANSYLSSVGYSATAINAIG